MPGASGGFSFTTSVETSRHAPERTTEDENSWTAWRRPRVAGGFVVEPNIEMRVEQAVVSSPGCRQNVVRRRGSFVHRIDLHHRDARVLGNRHQRGAGCVYSRRTRHAEIAPGGVLDV